MQIDGLGRAVRTAKTGFVNGVAGWNASGAVEYDKKGRTVKEGMTEFLQGDIQTLLESVPKMTSLFTYYEYDEKDRQIKTTLPDGSVQFARFEIKAGKSISYSTDPLGNVSVQESDSRGNIVRVAKSDKGGTQLTEVTYKYNAIGEMLNAYDAKGHPITAEYDLLGRRTVLESLDSGRQEFFYDECSNIVRENNSVLRESNKQFVIISDKYIEYLGKSETRVMSNKVGSRIYHRKYLGIIEKLNGFNYFIPLSSPKQKDYLQNGKIKNDSLITIYMKDSKRLYGTLRFNNMIPVPVSEIINYDLNAKGDLKYKLIIFNELYFVRQNKDKIEHTAKNLYEAKNNQDNQPDAQKPLLKMTLDFAQLEDLCLNFKK